MPSRDPTEARLYSMRDVLTLTGARPSQIENWNRTGVLVPQVPSTGTGNFRAYAFPDVVACAMAVQLSRYHMPAPAISVIVNSIMALATEVPLSRDRAEFLGTWRRFLNPATRTRSMDPIIMSTPDGDSWISINAKTVEFPGGVTWVGVGVGAIIRRLEKQTGDRWPLPGAPSTYGPRPTRKRKK